MFINQAQQDKNNIEIRNIDAKLDFNNKIKDFNIEINRLNTLIKEEYGN